MDDIEESLQYPHSSDWDRFFVAEKKITNQIRVYKKHLIRSFTFTEILDGDENSILRESPVFLGDALYDRIRPYGSRCDEDLDSIGIEPIDGDGLDIFESSLESLSHSCLVEEEYALSIDPLERPIGEGDIDTWCGRFDDDLIGTDLEIRGKYDDIRREEYEHQSDHTHQITIILDESYVTDCI
jgi:hypothetical protein